MSRLFLSLLTVLLLAACSADLFDRFASERQGDEVTYVLRPGDPNASPQQLERVATILRRRLEIAGLEGSVEAADGSIVVTEPSTGERTPVLGLMVRLGRVEFADLRNAPPDVLSSTNTVILATTSIPYASELNDPVTGEPYRTILDRVAVLDAQAVQNEITGDWEIALRFSPQHGELLAEYSAENTGSPIGILVDNVLVAAPIIQEPIGEEAVLTGGYSELEARTFAALLGAGMLPFELSMRPGE